MAAVDAESEKPGRASLWMKLRQIREAKLPIVSGTILLVVLLIPAFLGPWIAPHDPTAGSLPDRLLPPLGFGGTWEYALGTDRVGRDILSRIIYGARVSLFVSLTAIAAGAGIGAALGLIAGYFRGWIDDVIMRIVDTSLSIPSILLALALATAFGPSFATVIIVVVLAIWALFARQMRGVTLSVAQSDYVSRARVAGTSHGKILAVHIFPNVKNTLIVLATLQVGYVIIFEASLSFLGVGIPAPTPAWGRMVADGRDQIFDAWWVSFFPGCAIMLSVMALNSLGDWLRDRLDPLLRQV